MSEIIRKQIGPKYPHDGDVYDNLLERCSTGTRRTTMINEGRGLYPERGLAKVGTGGTRCVVTYGSFDPDWGGRTYAHCIEKMITSLENVGFDGFLYYRKGGYPESEGWELECADVPYAFKVWMLKEARDLGFSSCLWADAVFVANRSIDPLFDIVERKGALFINKGKKSKRRFKRALDRAVPPQTRRLLENFTGDRVCREVYGGLFGLKMDGERARSFLEKYDALVRMRLPFYSRFPEEVVFAALCSTPEFGPWTIDLPKWFVLVESDVSEAQRSARYFSRLCPEQPELDHVVKSLEGPVIREQPEKLRSSLLFP
ncbi:MAG: hypothetical protein OXF02_05255 [Simkaniaceae bacterium]|nr:hypothetical protein [Simkaniaceae bacterium]